MAFVVEFTSKIVLKVEHFNGVTITIHLHKHSHLNSVSFSPRISLIMTPNHVIPKAMQSLYNLDYIQVEPWGHRVRIGIKKLIKPGQVQLASRWLKRIRLNTHTLKVWFQRQINPCSTLFKTHIILLAF